MVICKVLLLFSGLLVLIIGFGTIIAIPAMLTLPRGIRKGIEELTITQAIAKLASSGKKDWELVNDARNLVGDRMEYCRRNNYQHCNKAFKRGYGFCQQKAFALASILRGLGFEAKPVQAPRNRFEFGVSGHSWVEVSFDGEKRFVDPQFQDRETDELLFEPLSRITGFSRVFRIFSGWGSALVNSIVYYRTGTDDIRS